MSRYKIREVDENDIEAIVQVYNSNYQFVVNHLGREFVDALFVFNEIEEMKRAGFLPCVIIDMQLGAVVGVIDYKPEDVVYLSLLMLDSGQQQNGVGSMVYHYFEENMRELGKSLIRIDVVNDYDENAVGFWEKQGFLPKDTVNLCWGDKQLTAIVMIKNLM